PDRKTLSMLMRAGVDIGAGAAVSQGISVQDSWWVNGRQRSLSAMRIVDADPAAKKLPRPPDDVAAVFAACGKARKTIQVPMRFDAQPVASDTDIPTPPVTPITDRIRDIVRRYRAQIADMLAQLPHDIPHLDSSSSPDVTSGPKKPVLVEAFGPLGYDCKAPHSGTFVLRRRTAGNLTVKLTFDVGTWNNALTAFMQVEGLTGGQAFKAT